MINETGESGRGSTTAGTVDRALDVLEVLLAARGSLGVRDLARRLDLSPSTVHRLLASLRSHGLVTQVGDSRAYQLGWAFLDYANALLADVRLADVAAPVARDLRDRTRETVTVQIPVGSDRVCVHEAEGLHEVRRRVGLGRRVPLHAGASGRAILAFLPEERIAALMPQFDAVTLTTLTVTDPGRLLHLVAETRRTGIATSEGESVDGVSSMATPVFDDTGAIAGSIAVSGPTARWTPEAMARHRSDLLDAGLAVSRGLGLRGARPFETAEQTVGLGARG